MRGPRRGTLSYVTRAQGGFDAVIRRIAETRRELGDDIRMKNKESARATDRSALPRKIACGDVCGDPGDTLYRMSCEPREALTTLFAEWRRLGDDIRMKNKKSARATDRSVLLRT